MKIPKIEYVEWLDAVASSGWGEHGGVDRCYSVGFLLKETAKYITLSAAVSGAEANAAISIPKAWIQKRRTIETARKIKPKKKT